MNTPCLPPLPGFVGWEEHVDLRYDEDAMEEDEDFYPDEDDESEEEFEHDEDDEGWFDDEDGTGDAFEDPWPMWA